MPTHAHAQNHEDATTETPETGPVPTAEAPHPPISILIEGISVTFPARFHTGHILTSVEAKVLNQTFAENIRNNRAGLVKKTKEEAGGQLTQESIDTLTSSILEYAEGYEFSGPRSPRTVADPVEAEARKLAKAEIVAALQRKGKKLSDFTAEIINEKVILLVQTRPQFRELARKRVDELKSIVSEGLEDLLA